MFGPLSLRMSPTTTFPTGRRAWLEAARPRTLPLALASIFMGSFLAAARGVFRWEVLALAALTTVLLQVLSNLANDWGDSVHGADGAHRQGPRRAVQAGAITARAMGWAVVGLAVLTLLAGLALLGVSLAGRPAAVLWAFVALGVAAIAAAITYTTGPRPYGYAGLGDFFVLLFFGWVGVLATCHLHGGSWHWADLLPATSCGLLAVGVLNVNNLRDLQSDRQAGKRSIPVRLGARRGRYYHVLLLTATMACAVAYVLLTAAGRSVGAWLFLLSFPLLIQNAVAVWKRQTPAALDPLLRHLALTTLLFVVTFGVGQVWG